MFAVIGIGSNLGMSEIHETENRPYAFLSAILDSEEAAEKWRKESQKNASVVRYIVEKI